MTEAVWSQYTDLQKIDLSHKAISVLTPGISECEGVETLYVSIRLFFKITKLILINFLL